MKNLIYAAAVLALAACAPANTPEASAAGTTTTGGTPAQATTSSSMSDMKVTPAAAPKSATAKAAEENRPMSYYQNKVAELHTTAGEIDIRFFPDVAPNHVKNFIDLAEKGFYNEIGRAHV